MVLLSNSCSASATSKGILPISINAAKAQANKAESVAVGDTQPGAKGVALIVPTLVEPTINATTINESTKIGSTNTPNVVHGWPQYLRNGLPESKPDKEKRNEIAQTDKLMQLSQPQPPNKEVAVKTESMPLSTNNMLPNNT